ncbi:nitrite reductase small subunit NirD [Streptacidiphilus sp. PAMC 29251]
MPKDDNRVELLLPDGRWLAVCAYRDLEPGHGVAVLLPGGVRAALFRTASGEVFAVDGQDPYSGAQVIADGIVGDRAGEPTITSPMHKQTFDLRTGVCLDEPDAPERALTVHQLRLTPPRPRLL